MPMKDSAKVGGAVERLMESEGVTSTQLSLDLYFSRSMVNHIKNDTRNMPAEVARESILLYDSPEYIMDILHTFSDGFTSPVLRGRNIEQHRLVIAAHVKREIRDALLLIEESGLEKPIGQLSTEEKEAVALLMNKLLDMRLHNDNFLKQLQVEYKLSIKQRIKAMMPRWKALGWLS